MAPAQHQHSTSTASGSTLAHNDTTGAKELQAGVAAQNLHQVPSSQCWGGPGARIPSLNTTPVLGDGPLTHPGSRFPAALPRAGVPALLRQPAPPSPPSSGTPNICTDQSSRNGAHNPANKGHIWKAGILLTSLQRNRSVCFLSSLSRCSIHTRSTGQCTVQCAGFLALLTFLITGIQIQVCKIYKVLFTKHHKCSMWRILGLSRVAGYAAAHNAGCSCTSYTCQTPTVGN